ncbi:MAG TPA: hypothetical protein VK395_28200 [Gemmataceae bacterium]|nr:hypothetical protein [Gemmataceae bacterium]
MRISAVSRPYLLRVPGGGRANRLVRAARNAAFLFILSAGCHGGATPGVTYIASAIVKGNDGKIMQQEESAIQVESALVDGGQEVVHEGSKFQLVVRKTAYGKATFEITFPDNSVQRIVVKAGETKDILPKGKNLGVRIEVQDSH